MISAKDAYEIIKRSFPEKHILDCSIYDGKAYLFTAKDKVDEDQYNDPFYLVDAKTKMIRQLNPLEDLDKFTNARAYHAIDISTLKDRKEGKV